MRPDDLRDIFDRQAAGYDQRWEVMAPVRDGLDLVVGASLVGLPDDARVLAVGVGTGAELAPLARRFPGWRFTAVDPSGAMLAGCRQRAERDGFEARCAFHEGTLDTLPPTGPHDAATCLLVSQFVVDRGARTAFFRAIADRLRPGGLLASADLAAGQSDFEMLLRTWLVATVGPDVTDERVDQAREAYRRDVAVWAPADVASVIEGGGFERPVQLFQAGLLHAWLSKRLALESTRAESETTRTDP